MCTGGLLVGGFRRGEGEGEGAYVCGDCLGAGAVDGTFGCGAEGGEGGALDVGLVYGGHGRGGWEGWWGNEGGVGADV